MKKLVTLVLVLLLAVAFTAPKAQAAKFELGDDSWMKLNFLGQVHYSFQDDAADEHDFFLRRGRFILSGQIMDGVKFFVETDNDNLGKNGVSSSMDIQDAFVDVRLGQTTHWVEAGLILLPFSQETISSAASLLGIDYNAEVVKLTNTYVWRDYGAMLRGTIADKVAYRIGVFDGYETSTKNSDADLRLTGHISAALIGDLKEAAWFLGQDQLGKSNYLVIGGGYDTQENATSVTTTSTAGVTTTTISDSKAWVVDMQGAYSLGELSLGKTDVILNGAYYDWDGTYKGKTGFVEGGIRVNKAMLTAKYSNQDADNVDKIEDVTVGLHYFLKDHNAKAGIEYRTGDSADLVLVGLQFLL